MMFKLEGENGVHFWCSSPTTARRLMAQGARLVDEAQAEYLRLLLEFAPPEGLLALGPPRSPRH